jgi:hypothetical protein
MTASEIEQYFPRLKGQVDITSPHDEEYNCIAWSLNDKKQWWWPTPAGQKRWPGKYWPPGIANEETLDAFTSAYQLVRFEVCDDRQFEVGYDKVALYAGPLGNITHAARWWREDRGWSSKLGEQNDICHHSLETVEGKSYGTVVQIMRRMRTGA